MLGVAVRMAVGRGRRSTCLLHDDRAIAAVLVTDSIYGWIQLHGSYTPGDPLDGGWIVYYVLLGAAALHPSMRTVSHATATKAKAHACPDPRHLCRSTDRTGRGDAQVLGAR